MTGIVDLGRVAAWSMLAASDIPLQYIGALLYGRLSLAVGTAMKKRLLEGALSIDETEVRRQGFSTLMARLNEASIVEQAGVADVFALLAAAAQVVAGVFLFTRGAMPQICPVLALSAVVGAVAVCVARIRQYSKCYSARLSLTEDLVDNIIGHRTRSQQQNPLHFHDGEDVALGHYAKTRAAYDRFACLASLYGRLWLVVAGVSVLASFALGAGQTPLLLSGAATLLVYRGFTSFSDTSGRLVLYIQAWMGVRSLFAAGRARERRSRSGLESRDEGLDTVVSSVFFSYGGRTRPVLAGADLRIKSGERILIEGPSGGGKTTLSKLLTGELRASSGTILVEGVDLLSVAETEWRRRVASAPQFHENYLFSHTFGFNVDPKSLDGEMSQEAEELCAELGLDELLRKMPGGKAQVLGETGWQLSHGERSRVFVARALLQGASLVVFDESFAALDPDSLRRAVECARRRARTLAIIAHT
jgi:ATP-binding cassette subfamily B protein